MILILNREERIKDKRDKRKKKKKKKIGLSFDQDDEGSDDHEEDASATIPKSKKLKSMKNPDVDTSFLPDKEREEQERILREKLREEWVEKQAAIKGKQTAESILFTDEFELLNILLFLLASFLLFVFVVLYTVNAFSQCLAEDIEITYSYWDGSGHRYSIKVKKGDTVGKFLQKCLEKLRKDFPELRVVAVDNVMYIKEDLIIPQVCC